MNSSNNSPKALIIFLIVVIGILAISTGYLFAKNMSLTKTASSDTDKTVTDTPTITASASVTPSVSATVSPTVMASATATPTATPAATKTVATTGQKYTVKAGDTMYSIALQYKVNWIKLAEANGLTEQTANNIKVGQVLVIPE